MTGHDPKHGPDTGPDDRELEDFLAGRSPLSRVHREGAQEQAPPELDAKVLQAAREELRQARRPRRLLRWDSPLALAASMVLVLGLGWLTQYRVAAPVVQGEVTSAPAPVAAPPPRQQPAQSDKQAAAADQQTAAAAAPPQQIVTNGPMEMAKSAPGGAAPPPAQPQLQAKDASPTPPQPPVREKNVAPAKPVPPPQAPPVLTQQAPSAAFNAVPAEAAPPIATGSLADKPSALAAQQQRDSLAKEEQAQDQVLAQKQKRSAEAHGQTTMAAPMAAAPPPPVQPAPAREPEADQRAVSDAPAPAPMPAPAPNANPFPNAGMSVPSARLADPCAAPQRAPEQRQAQPEQHQDVSQWLDQIRHLRQTDESAARAELACFAARRSPAEVPEDLQPLLPGR